MHEKVRKFIQNILRDSSGRSLPFNRQCAFQVSEFLLPLCDDVIHIQYYSLVYVKKKFRPDIRNYSL